MVSYNNDESKREIGSMTVQTIL